MPINLIIRNPLDRDAREFFARAGVTDAGGRAQLNGFVRGVKGLGLWNSMVCWPLRSSQNAGTGTTAYSLGGLGTFNGTLVNGPTWGTDGVSFTKASSHYISTGFIVPSGPFWLALDYALVFTSGNNALITSNDFVTRQFSLYANGTAPNPLICAANIGAGEINAFNGLTNTGTANRQFVQFGHASNLFLARRNNETAQTLNGTGTLVSTTVSVQIGRWTSVGAPQHFNGTMGFAMAATAAIDSSKTSALYELYRGTIGTGLGLP